MRANPAILLALSLTAIAARPGSGLAAELGTPPHFLMIGVWPLLMGLTMFLQQRLNPQPPDPVQAKIMSFLPVMFTFLFATFPAGLVIYWTWNNLLSIGQQWLIMKRMGIANPTA